MGEEMTRVRSRNSRRKAGGFTLIEAVFSIIIIGFAVSALMLLLGTGTKVTAYGNRLSQAVFLAEEMRAMTDDVEYTNLLSYDGVIYNGVDANGKILPGVEGFQQQLIVQGVNPADMTLAVGNVDMIRITAVVTYFGSEMTRISWLRTW